MNGNLKISVVTVCFNGIKYIDKTIESVISQNYHNLEYIVIDGGSTDGTQDVVNKYKNKLSLFISEPDSGQYYAIQKGFNHATGDIMAWLNSDDTYFPWTFSIVNEIFTQYPEVQWIIGIPSYQNNKGQCTRISSSIQSYPRKYIANGWFRQNLAGYLQQESMFWRKSLWDKVNGLDLEYKYAADFDLWIRFAKFAPLIPLAIPLALFRLLPGEQKSSIAKDEYLMEVSNICKPLPSPSRLWAYLVETIPKINHLIRLFIWKKTQIIYFPFSCVSLEMNECYRPLSKWLFADLILEYISNFRKIKDVDLN